MRNIHGWWLAIAILAGACSGDGPGGGAVPPDGGGGCLADGAQCSLDGLCCAMNCRADGTCGGNRAPVASAGPDAGAYKRTTVTLDGSGSSDPDGDRIYHSWTLARPAGSYATLSSSTAQRPTFQTDVAGTYVASLSVTDGLLTGGDSVAITVVNRPPVADLGGDRVVQRNAQVLLLGSTSSDPDGDTLYHSFALTSKPTGSTATLVYEGADWARSIRPDRLGDYVVTLTVRDGPAGSAALSDDVSIVVTAVNGPPVAEIEAYAAANAGTLVAARGGYSRDPNGDPLAYAWQLALPAGSAAALTSTTAVDTGFTPDVPGTYTLSLTVSDGTLSDTATKDVTVYPRVHLLDHDVADAVYDDARSEIVMASASPYAAVCRYALIAQSESCNYRITGGAMRSVTISADARSLAYGRVGAVGWDQDGSTWKECTVTWDDGGVARPFDPASVALGPPVTIGKGATARVTRFLHATPAPGGGRGVVTVDVGDCTFSTADAPPAGFDGAAALRPGTATLYAIDAANGGSVWTWDTSALPAPMPAPTVASPGAAPGRRFWFHGDGTRLVTSTGTVFQAELAFDGAAYTLAGVGLLGNPGVSDPAPLCVHANHSAALGRIAAIPATGDSPTRLDGEVRQYSAADLSAVGAPLPLPPIASASTVSPSYGTFVFYKGDGTKLYAILTTESAIYAPRRGIVTLVP